MFYLQHVYCVNLQIVVGKKHSPFFRCSLKVLSFSNCPSNCQDLHLTAKKVHVNQKLCFICINYSSARNSIVCMRLQYCDSIKFIQNKYNWIVKFLKSSIKASIVFFSHEIYSTRTGCCAIVNQHPFVFPTFVLGSQPCLCILPCILFSTKEEQYRTSTSMYLH